MLLTEVKKQLSHLPPFKKVVVGVSGGADSVALAYVMLQLCYDVTIAHLNHSLRGKESDADEEFVTQLARTWNVPIVTQKISIPKKGNLENTARKLRYDFLEKIRIEKSAKYIAVAHHADDQTESILMHIQRGAGLRGLCGMNLVTNNIIRPLLTLHKKEITDYLASEKLTYRTDSSNFDLKFKRNYLRHAVLPKIRQGNDDFETKLLQFSKAARMRMQEIEKQAKVWIKNNVTNLKFERSDFLALTNDVQSEVLFMLIGYDDVYSKAIQELKDLIKKGVTGKHKKIGDIVVRSQYGTIIIERQIVKTTMNPKVRLTESGVKWGCWNIKYNGDEELFVRAWKTGDRFEPLGMKGGKKLQDFFVDRKIPKSERQNIPIIVDKDDNVLSVSDFRVAKNALYLKKCLKINKIK